MIVISFFVLSNSQRTGDEVEIEVNGKIKNKYPLAENKTFMVSNDGYNIICIKNGKVWVKDADCKGKDCIRSGKISKAGEAIICMPHRLTIKIISDSAAETDGVSR